MLMLLFYITKLIIALNQLGTDVEIQQEGPHTVYTISENAFIETYEYESDSTLVIETVCAPICSSRARVYNKEWLLLHSYDTPADAIFPEAKVDSLGHLMWQDNSSLLLLDD